METATDIPADREWCLSPKWIRGVANGHTIVDTRRAMILRQDGRPPVYCFPPQDVNMVYLKPSPGQSRQRRYWDMAGGQRRAAWEIPDAVMTSPDAAAYLVFDWAAMDAWFEEDEEVLVHPRDPRVRLDILHSSRHIRIEILDETVAESRNPVLLFETGLPVRYYIPKTEVRLDLLEPSQHLTRCPYKGEAHYYSVKIGDRYAENIAWYYRYPTAESLKIASLIAFYDEQVDALYVDGERMK